MGSNGYVAIHRKLADHWLWSERPFSRGQAWIDLVLLANHAPNKFVANNTIINVDRGQTSRSEVQMAKDWGWSRGKVRRFLKLLVEDEMILRQTVQGYTLISILKYEEYQLGGTLLGQGSVQDSDTQRYTNKKDKKEKNNNTVEIPTNSDQIKDVFNTYLTEFGASPNQVKLSDARKAKIKARLKDAGLEMILKAIRNTAKDSFYRGDNNRNWKANLDFIIRNYEQVEKLANLGSSQTKRYWTPEDNKEDD